jgi:hypothetical protein
MESAVTILTLNVQSASATLVLLAVFAALRLAVQLQD